MSESFRDQLLKIKENTTFPKAEDKQSIEVKVKKSQKKKLPATASPSTKDNNERVVPSMELRKSKKPERNKHRAAKTRSQQPKSKATTSEPLCLIGDRPKERSKKPTVKVDSSQYKVALLEDLPKPKRTGLSSLVKTLSALGEFERLPESSPDGREADFFIGLDFGTAFTKVVIGIEGTAYAVRLTKNDGLLPSAIKINAEGKCSLKMEKEYKSYTDLKLPLLTESATSEDLSLIVAFIALVFIKCREWHASSHLSDLKPNWFINAGLPTKSYSDVLQ